MDLRYTLLCDGGSDRALLPILTWLLVEHGVKCAIQPALSDLHHLPRRPKGLVERIRYSIELFPCELLFVHRDAEAQPPQLRRDEIGQAVSALAQSNSAPPLVCVVPVRMQEAWLLINEMAVRRAVGNPNGHQQLTIPQLSRLESIPDPKDTLHSLLKEASGLRGRKLKRFDPYRYAHRIAEYIEDFAPLRRLTAFTFLEADVARIIQEHGWDTLS